MLRVQDYSQIAEFDKIVLDIFLKENYREVLNMTERVTVRLLYQQMKIFSLYTNHVKSKNTLCR
jgi:hypothetical protein